MNRSCKIAKEAPWIFKNVFKLQIFKSSEEFKEEIDIDIFPESYGGKESQDDLISHFKKQMYRKRDKIKALDDMRVQLAKEEN